MSERLPYEEQLAQQWSDLPLPDENMAWADMKRRLDKDDDDGVVVAWWRRGCGLWGLLLLGLLAVGWWVVRPEKWFNQKSKTEKNTVISKQTDSTGKNNNTGNSNDPAGNNNGTTNSSATTVGGNNGQPASPANTVDGKNNSGKTPVAGNDPMKNPVNTTDPVTTQSKTTTVSRRPNVNITPTTVRRNANRPATNSPGNQPVRNRPGTNQPVITNPVSQPNTSNPGKTPTGQPPLTNKPGDSLSVQKSNPDSNTVGITKVDSTIAKTSTPDSLVKKDSVRKEPPVASTTKADSSKKRKTFFSAGVAVHQLLPIAGQKTSPYNALGRKGTLLDYIPSLYLRFNKEDKWFIQAEFRYGVPQYTKDLLYDQKIVPDTGTNPRFVTTTSTRLQKSYYHQLPLSFNYYVMPNWSIGAGVIWNRFSTAISDRSVNRYDNFIQQDTVVVKEIVRQKGDSLTAFSRSYFQAMFETQYQWKRFSIGARYSVGLEPYLRFTLPNGVPQKERNQSVQVFLRYQLWRSKPK